MYGMIGNTVDKNRKCERNDIVCNLGILTYSGGCFGSAVGSGCLEYVCGMEDEECV